MEFRLLGAVEARTGNDVIDLGSFRQQCVLVVLLIDANQVVSVDQLIHRVWDDAHARRATLYSYVSRLRKALSCTEDIEITRKSGGYVLAVDPMTVDLHQFQHLTGLARETADIELAATRYEQALRLWRGQTFAGMDTAWLNQSRTRLEAERRTAQLHRNELMLRLGRYTHVLDELATSAAENPLDERLAGQLMLALYRTGRRADALRAHQRIRVDLAEELGIAPGPELRDLYQRMLTESHPVQLLQGFARPGWNGFIQRFDS
nr:AfsR/SARP family transcriptional regulator [Kibdelosporangium sp. MJ126-NF4]CEL21900.1 transcriptional regulator, SARP family [Kibdelosporangium sp. MJ126-NF4]CTQ92679.1 transcriptional regulator, SARP family [Kibdelosporangium sp. MJ126-NF4]